MKGKKGNRGIGCKGNAVLDGMLILVILVVLSLATVFSYSIFTEVNTDIQNDPDMLPVAKNVTEAYHTVYPSLWDNLFLLIFALLVMGLIVSVFLLDTNPLLMFINLLLIISVLVVAALVANVYDDLASDSTISSAASQFPFIAWISSHLLTVSVAMVFIMLLAMFAKAKIT